MSLFVAYGFIIIVSCVTTREEFKSFPFISKDSLVWQPLSLSWLLFYLTHVITSVPTPDLFISLSFLCRIFLQYYFVVFLADSFIVINLELEPRVCFFATEKDLIAFWYLIQRIEILFPWTEYFKSGQGNRIHQYVTKKSIEDQVVLQDYRQYKVWHQSLSSMQLFLFFFSSSFVCHLGLLAHPVKNNVLFSRKKYCDHGPGSRMGSSCCLLLPFLYTFRVT